MSTCSVDVFTGRHPGNYLQRTSQLQGVSVVPGASESEIASMAPTLRMVLTGVGPLIVHRSTLCVQHMVRRVGTIMYSALTSCGCCVFFSIPRCGQ